MVRIRAVKARCCLPVWRVDEAVAALAYARIVIICVVGIVAAEIVECKVPISIAFLWNIEHELATADKEVAHSEGVSDSVPGIVMTLYIHILDIWTQSLHRDVEGDIGCI